MSAIGPGTNELKQIAPEYVHPGKYHEIQSGSQSSIKTAQRLMLTMMTMIMMMLALMTRILRNIKVIVPVVPAVPVMVLENYTLQYYHTI